MGFMRRIETAKETAIRQKRKAKIISFFMLIILVGSIAGFAFLSNPEDNSQTTNGDTNGEKVQNIGSQWVIKFNGENIILNYGPEDVKNIDVSILYDLNGFYGKDLYIASNNTGITSEIASTLGRYVSKTQRACYLKCEEDLPEKDCTENLIVYIENKENRVYQQDNCIFIEGDLRAADAFLYKIFLKE